MTMAFRTAERVGSQGYAGVDAGCFRPIGSAKLRSHPLNLL
jgi:hypothetical protein